MLEIYLSTALKDDSLRPCKVYKTAFQNTALALLLDTVPHRNLTSSFLSIVTSLTVRSLASSEYTGLLLRLQLTFTLQDESNIAIHFCISLE